MIVMTVVVVMWMRSRSRRSGMEVLLGGSASGRDSNGVLLSWLVRGKG